jgi:S1-C subfamily serine protease
MLVHLADAEELPTFREAARHEAGMSPASLEQPVAPQAPRYGMPFRVEAGSPPRVFVTDVNAGSPADLGGLKAGDRLLEFQGRAINDDAQLRLNLLAARGEATFLVQRPGSETPLLLKVTPRGEPVRVGITWRLDDGEPGTAIVTQVIYGSAAHAAGIRVADRVYSVGGRTFRSQDEFIGLLTSAASQLEIVVERGGRLRSANLQLAEQSPPAE